MENSLTPDQRERAEAIKRESLARLALLDTELKTLLKHEIKVNCRVDLLATEVLGYSLEDFHMQIILFYIQVMSERGEGLVEAPRGFGKSTIGTTTFAIFLVLINPNIRILITSSTASKAEGFLQEIKAHFEYNEVLREIFGDYVNQKGWTSNMIHVRPRTLIAKEGTISAFGQSGQVVSKHYDVILNDDPVNEDTARTRLRRDKLKDWIYTSLFPTLMPEGFMVTTGTRYHPEDFFGHMEEVAKSISSNKKSSGQKDSITKPLRILKLKAIIDEGKSTERSLWESRFPLEKLKELKRKMGSIRFGGQMQQETDLMKGKIIKEKDIQWFKREKLNTSRLQIYMGVDLAAGRKDTNDKFALVTKGYDPFTNKAYTLDIVHGQFSFREQVTLALWKAGKSIREIEAVTGYRNLSVKHLEEIIALNMPEEARKFALKQWPQVIRIGIEAVSYQTVLPDELITMWATMPIVKVKALKDKPTRITKYSPRFENELEYLPEDGSADILKDELIAFPDGDFDDLADAHEICNQVRDMVFSDEEEEEDVSVKVF